MKTSDGESHQLQPGRWLSAYGNSLYSYALIKTGDAKTAEDLLQDTFLSGIRAQASFKGNSTEKTWLFSILKNKIIDYYRKKDVLKDVSAYIADTEPGFSGHFFEQTD